jgi:CDP-diacylglycerol--glycerol-3-phosphate 3-phosphatidyltransferase
MKSVLTLSNLLSLSRIILLIPLLYCLSLESATGNYTALLISLVAMLTDYLDGISARKFNTVTTLGKYLDPIADKLCVFGVAIYLSYFRKNLAEWFTFLLIIKDILIIVGGAYLVLWKKIVIQSEPAGKWAVFYVALTFGFYILNYRTLGSILMYISLISVLYSSWFYFKKFMRLLHSC